MDFGKFIIKKKTQIWKLYIRILQEATKMATPRFKWKVFFFVVNKKERKNIQRQREEATGKRKKQTGHGQSYLREKGEQQQRIVRDRIERSRGLVRGICVDCEENYFITGQVCKGWSFQVTLLVNILQFVEAIAGGKGDNGLIGVRCTGVEASLLSLNLLCYVNQFPLPQKWYFLAFPLRELF